MTHSYRLTPMDLICLLAVAAFAGAYLALALGAVRLFEHIIETR